MSEKRYMTTIGMEQVELLPHVTECRDLHKLNTSDLCHFINMTDVCHLSGGFLDYVYFSYCTLGSRLLPLTVSVLFCWLIFMFIAIAVAADDFFCPVLVVISKTLRMSDNLAGVTLLAFGNGAADVFSAIAAVTGSKNGDVSLALCALMGAGVFVTTVIAGSVCITRPFKIMERPFLRDVIFYLGAVFFTFFILYNGKITTLEATVYILLYVVYVLVVLTARFIHKRMSSSNINTECKGSVNSVDEDRDGENTLDQPIYIDCHGSLNTDSDSTQNVTDEQLQPSLDESTPLIKNDTGDAVSSSSHIKEFLSAISPVDILQWNQSGCATKLIAVIKGTAKLILRLTVPVVDYTALNHNWNKILSMILCVTSPLMALYLGKPELFLYQIHGVFPVWTIVLISGSLISLVVYCTSSSSHPPCYHWLFAYAGFIVAVIWMQCIATEIVNLLQTFGIIFNLSNGILGLTLLAWGNSISDLISDVTMARHGYPRTAISACYGGPMFNLLLGIGIPFTLVCIQNGGSVSITMNLVELLLVSYLFLILAGTMVIVPFILKFDMSAKFGASLYGVYVAFIILVILVQSNVIMFSV